MKSSTKKTNFDHATCNSLNPEEWVDKYGDYLFNLALTQLRNHVEAENVVQETFLAALKSKSKFSGKSHEKTWLTGILKHKIIDYIRNTYNQVPMTDVLEDSEKDIDRFFDNDNHHVKQPSKWAAQPHEIIENKEFLGVLRDCMGNLPKSAYDAFNLREIKNLKSKEICEILNITKTNFWVLLHRARLRLRKCLEINWFD